MADAFMSALYGAKEVRFGATQKIGNETRSVKFRDVVPGDMSKEAFVQAAREGGIDLSVKVKDGEDKGRNGSGKGSFGAQAVNATASVLGVSVKPDAVPEKVRKRAENVAVPSDNKGAATDGAASK